MKKNNGMVVCPEPLAAEVGAQVLRDGGNAFDAAVACAFMEMAVNPIQCGLGGWGGGLVYDAKTKKTEHLGFWARIGSKMSPDMWLEDLKGYTEMWRFALFDDHRAVMGYTSCMDPRHGRRLRRDPRQVLLQAVAVNSSSPARRRLPERIPSAPLHCHVLGRRVHPRPAHLPRDPRQNARLEGPLVPR